MAEAGPGLGADSRALIRKLMSGELDLDDAPAALVEGVLKLTKRSKDEFRAHLAARREREERAPKPGSAAPDFELELLTREGKRSGELRRLGDHRGRPVALVFGSYT